jgi:6-phosphogluconolactonase (cycloisomerase 2 family)
MNTDRIMMFKISALLVLATLELAACGGDSNGGGSNSYTISANVYGLLSGSRLILQESDNSAYSSITVVADGSFGFKTPVSSGSSYAVTIASQPAGQSCVLQNGSGTVSSANVSTVTVRCSPLPYTVNVKVSGIAAPSGLVLQNNGDDNLAVSSTGTLAFATVVSSGSPYAVTILTQPANHTCLVIDGSGKVTNANVTVSVVCPWNVLYSANGAGVSGISAYYLDQTTGNLSAAVVGSPFTTTTNLSPSSVALTPNGQFGYVPGGSGEVSAFAINATTGGLTAIAGSPLSVGANLTSIAIDPSGRFLYVMDNGSNIIPAFSIDASTGALTAVPGSPFSTSAAAGGNSQQVLAIDPSGQFLYAAGGALLAFKIDASTGALSQITGSPFTLAGAQGFRAITVTPSGGFVICAGWSGPLQSSAYVYSLNESTGALTFVGSGSQNGISFTSAAVDPTSRFLYVGDDGIGSDNIEAFTINASTGALTAVSGSPFPATNNPQSLVIAPTGGTLYAGGAGIYEFAIDASTGALTTIFGNQGSYIFGSSGLFLSQLP